MKKQVKKTVETKPTKTKKPYKANALLALTIISLAISVAVFIAGIVLLAAGPESYIYQAKRYELAPLYIVMIIDGVLATICACLTLPARRTCRSFGLMLALGICNIIFCINPIQIALGIITIVHANKIKKGLWPAK